MSNIKEENKNEYVYTDEEKINFLKIYNSFLQEVMKRLNEVSANLSQVSVSGSANVTLMSNSFRFLTESMMISEEMMDLFDDLDNNVFSENIQRFLENMNENEVSKQ